MPDKSRLVDYADVVAALVAKFRVSGWTAHGFILAQENTEMVILIKNRIPTQYPKSMLELIIEPKALVNFLGLTFNPKISFSEQIKAIVNKAATLDREIRH